MTYAIFNCKSGFTLNSKQKIIKSHWVEYWKTNTNKKVTSIRLHGMMRGFVNQMCNFVVPIWYQILSSVRASAGDDF